jgi:penicillin-binding protein 2
MKAKRRRPSHEIAPDEIFLDTQISDDFDRDRFEGRLERPLTRSSFVTIGIVIGVVFLFLIGGAWNLQIRQGTLYAAESAHNSLAATTIFAERGTIVDDTGAVLAENEQASDGSVQRVYTIPAMGQVIGYVSYPKKDSSGNYYDTEETGVTGIEEEFNSTLAGQNGQLLAETDAFGHVQSQGTIVPAVNGSTLQLSIDGNLESLFANALADISNKEHFIGGAGVIIDVHTGAVKAIVSYPYYDPNVMSNGEPVATIAAYDTDPDRPFLDRAVAGLYAPGSIVKPMEAAGALTDGVITPETTVNDPGFISIPDPYDPTQTYIYKDWKVLGIVDVEKAIAWSSDVFFYTVGGGYGDIKGLGIDRLDYWFEQFGLGEPTGIDLPGEASGLVPSPAWKEATLGQPWYLGDTYHTAIGQYSMQVTPIQMVRAIAAVANGGQLLTPTILAGQKPEYTTVPVSAASIETVHEGMRLGVTSALSEAINLPYVSVAAKTGTAQVGALNQYDNAWVEGFWPYDNPEYAFAVVLERGPVGVGEEGVNVMQELFESLYAENSPLLSGGEATSTATE